jgi:outer membrane protein OmpA-like peptidoglycan-associated protein/peptidoglycan hydrolase-like protein with peptidoglycan-binding domain
MPAKPMLDDIELQQVQKIESEDESAVQQHSIPALEGDFLQDLGRRSTCVGLTGVLTGPDAAKGLRNLREKFQKAEPISFVADIATATVVGKVMIEQMEVEELAGKPERFAYALSVLEFVPPPKPETEPPPPPPPPPPLPKVDTGTLVAEVIVQGQPEFDFSTVTLTVAGVEDDGTDFSRTFTERKGNVWTDEAMPPGSYTAKAEVAESQAMSGTADAKIQAGQTTKVTITLTPGGVVATEFVVTFRFDKAFVEPCMRQVLKQVMQFANGHKDQKLLIVGHTDLVGTPISLTGPDPYNQSLSERRARAVYAYLTFGRDQATTDASVADWTALRMKQSGGVKPTLADSWGTREYQHMLQDLGFYPGAVDGKEGKITQEAVRAFRCHSGLPPATTMDDPAWDRLIRAYMGQDNFALADDRFLRNCGAEPLKWIGCASQDPVKNVRVAHRPNRRVELLFTSDSKLPCNVPRPDTFDLSPPGPVGSDWCVGPGDKNKRACFVVPHLPKDGKPKDKEWTRVPAEPGSIEVQVSIKKEVKNADGTIERKPAPGAKFVIITPDGQFLKDEQSRGEPNPDTTPDGTKKYSDKQLGFYSLEIMPKPDGTSVLVQMEDAPGADAKGNAVCKHLTTDDATLNVVILLDPVLRQVRLPAAAHLMRALNPNTRVVRTCPLFGKPGSTFEQKTTRDAAAVRAAFAVANEIWRQARLRFDLSDVVEEAYSFSGECEVTNQTEFPFLLSHGAYPQVMNIFFVADLEGKGEAGVGVSIENGAAEGITGGGAVGDRFQFTIIGIPTDRLLDPQQTAQVLAHELGHVLNLDHTSEDAPDEKRLMFPHTGLSGDNTVLVADEIATARASKGAGFECIPLTLKVTGATQFGGSLGHEFIVIQDTAKVVTVDAEISDELLAEGTVTMKGGNAGANDRQRTVSAAKAGPPVEVTATYTPNSGGDVITKRKITLVATFELRMEIDGAQQPKGTKLMVKRSKGKVITVVADIQPSPICVPKDLVNWAGGDEAPDFLRRTISMDTIAITTVTATVAGVTQSVTITVIDVAFTDNVAPFDKTIDTVQIEGILNKDRASFELGDLFGTQAKSLFRARADFPGIAGNTIQGQLVSNLPNTAIVEARQIVLKRTTGDRFVSLPILAIPLAIPLGDVTMKDPSKPDLEMIRTTAGGSLRLQVPGNTPGPGVAIAKVSGRVAELCTVTIAGASNKPQRDIDTANRVWAQLGIEVRVLESKTVTDPTLLKITDAPIKGPASKDETKLFSLGRDTCVAGVIGYYVQSTTRAGLGVTLVVPHNAGFYQNDLASQYTFGHELGHVLGLDHIVDSKNLMNEDGTLVLPKEPNSVQLLPDQFQKIEFSAFLNFRP